MIQHIVTFVIVAAAITYAAWRTYRLFHHQANHCHDCCEACKDECTGCPRLS